MKAIKFILAVIITCLTWYSANAQTYQGIPIKFNVSVLNITATVDKVLTDQEAESFFVSIYQAFGPSLKGRYLITKSGTYYRPGFSKKKPKKI